MNKIEKKDIPALSLGAALLGSGGGGTPTYEPLILSNLIDQCGPIPLISSDQLVTEDYVMPVAYMGAPSVNIEKLSNGKEYEIIKQNVKTFLGKTPSVLISAEIGGSNAFTAPLLSHKLKLPVLDADLIGRAFPQLEMSTPHIFGISASPAFIADSLGKSAILQAQDAATIELLARHVTIACGSSAAIALYFMSGAEAKNSVVVGSISRACILGSLILHAQAQGLRAPEYLAKKTDTRIIATGTIQNIHTQIINGFTTGRVTVEGDQSVTVFYKNEFLLATNDQGVCAETPDIIAILDEETGVPIQTDSLAYGLRVAIVTLPAPAIWKTKKGLALTGPQAFDLSIYKDI